MSQKKDTLGDLIEEIREKLSLGKETDPAKRTLFSTIIPGAENPLVVSTSNIDNCVRILWMHTKNSPDSFYNLCRRLWANHVYYEELKVAIRLLRKMARKDPGNVFKIVQI
jgi:hypothetical protein